MPTVTNRLLHVYPRLAATIVIAFGLLSSSGCRRWDPIAVVPVSGPVELRAQEPISFNLTPVFMPKRMVNTVCVETAVSLNVTLPRQLDSNGNFTGFGSAEARNIDNNIVEISAVLRRTDGMEIVLNNIDEWGPSRVCYGASQQKDEWYSISESRSVFNQVIVRSNIPMKVNRIYIESYDPWDREK